MFVLFRQSLEWHTRKTQKNKTSFGNFQVVFTETENHQMIMMATNLFTIPIPCSRSNFFFHTLPLWVNSLKTSPKLSQKKQQQLCSTWSHLKKYLVQRRTKNQIKKQKLFAGFTNQNHKVNCLLTKKALTFDFEPVNNFVS